MIPLKGALTFLAALVLLVVILWLIPANRYEQLDAATVLGAPEVPILRVDTMFVDPPEECQIVGAFAEKTLYAC